MGSGLDNRVAIVVPCYNAERTLADTLESALGQTGVSVDVVVVDDGSKDGSLSVARRFEPHVRILTGPNRGVSAARNTGIAESFSPWMVFLDADDCLEPGSLEKRLAVACERRADVVISEWVDLCDDGAGVVRNGDHHTIDWAALDQNPTVAIASGVWATTAAILYSRAIVNRIGGFRRDLPIIQDARFMFDAAFHGAKFARADHVGARYRILEGSLSRATPARFWQDVLLNGQQIEALWRSAGGLDRDKLRIIAGIYDNAARGLFLVADPAYFAALAAQHHLDMPVSRHALVAGSLSRVIGIRAARSLLQFAWGRA